ncbi:phosphotransferase enzyme family protein [Burkholderia plantarii]|uniref:phosphotransferase enzyme family protein n=1 Tax=Burkholderia plantarii TaxID=41899 RepID=UPI0018DE8D41|nr:phosphotransferase [Burkholderia plantarii]MBI0330414.1 phosphotransferase [Burkholderia plantarii]
MTNGNLDVIRDACEKWYGFSPEMVTEIIHGVNHTFRINHGKVIYYAKLYSHDQTIEHIKLTHKLLLDFNDTERASVSKPLIARDDASFRWIRVNSQLRLLSIYSEAKGTAVALTEKEMCIVGRAVAEIHEQFSSSGARASSLDIPHIIDVSLDFIVKSDIPDDFKIFLTERSKNYVRSVENKHLECGIIHGDLDILNIRLHGNGCSFFDFEMLFNGPLLFDIAAILLSIFSNESSCESSRPLVLSILRSYQDYKALSAAEVAVLPSAVFAKCIRSIAFLSRNCLIPSAMWPTVFIRTSEVLERMNKTLLDL